MWTDVRVGRKMKETVTNPGRYRRWESPFTLLTLVPIVAPRGLVVLSNLLFPPYPLTYILFPGPFSRTVSGSRPTTYAAAGDGSRRGRPSTTRPTETPVVVGTTAGVSAYTPGERGSPEPCV